MAKSKRRMEQETVADRMEQEQVAVEVPPTPVEAVKEEESEWKKPFFIGLIGIVLLIVGWIWTSYQVSGIVKRYYQPIPLALFTGICPLIFWALHSPAIVYRWLGIAKPEGKQPWKDLAITAIPISLFYWTMLAFLQICILRIGWRETTIFTSILAPLMILAALGNKTGVTAGKRETFTWIGAIGIVAILPVSLYFEPSPRLWTTHVACLIALLLTMTAFTLALRFWVVQRKHLNPFTVMGMTGAYSAALFILLWLLAKGFSWTWLEWPKSAIQWRVFTYTGTIGFLIICGYTLATLLTGELVAAVALAAGLPLGAVWDSLAMGKKWPDYQFFTLIVALLALILCAMGIRKEHQRGMH